MSTEPTDDVVGHKNGGGDAHPDGDDTIISTMYFLPRSPKYLIEKPYTMRYAPTSVSAAMDHPPPPPTTTSTTTSSTLPPQTSPTHSPQTPSPSASPSPPPSSSSSSTSPPPHTAPSPSSSFTSHAEPPIPQTNIELDQHTLAFRNLRTAPQMSYEACGFMVARMKESSSGSGSMRYEDFADAELVEGRHGREVAECVREALGARTVEVLDSVVRRRHPTWPIATGESYEFQQPASRAHIDHTYEAGCQIIRDVYGTKANPIIASGQWQCVNVWHPLRGPLTDWPLALCDASTVDFALDTMPGDVVDREAVFENTQVHFNTAQRWYYLKDQLPEELLVFKNADGKKGGTPGVPHASFDNPLTKESDIRRESVEFRVLVLW